MKQGKKQSKFDFETLIIGITWLLVLFMFTVSMVSCGHEAECNTDGVYCIDRNLWWECNAGQWDKAHSMTSYCEDNAIYEGSPSTCDIIDEQIKYVCYMWICLPNGTYQRLATSDGDCDIYSVLPE